MQPVKTEYFALQGGLDLVSPALALAPGKLIDSVNYEPDINGGYRRMYGIERYDGRTQPSAGSYWNMAVALTGSVAVGNTVTGASSGATAVVLQVNGTTELIVTKLTGTFVSETITVAAANKGTVSSVGMNAATTPILHATYKGLAADNYRADIAKVPGSGAVRGVWYYAGNLYAFRDNVGASACVMHKATTSGWTPVTMGREIQFSQQSSTITVTIAAPGVVTWAGHGLPANQPIVFSTTGALPTGITAGTTYYVLAPGANTFTFAATSGGSAITTSGTQSGTHTCVATPGQVADGDVVTGATSGATATVRRALLRTGTWNTSPIGSLVFLTVTGTFSSGEALLVGGVAKLRSTTADTAITLSPGGRYEFINYNFSGTLATYRMYGCDGVNFAFEFDGTYYVPIRTGISTDTPTYLTAWKNMLVMAFRSSVQVSGIGQPFSWTALTGAAELALGANCTGLLPQLGDSTKGALVIGAGGTGDAGNKTFILYGNSTADFNMVTNSPDSGPQPFTMQNIGFAYFLDTKGMVQINSTRNFGNFEMSTLTRMIQPIIDAKRGLATASCIVRGTNQYRLFFSDGTGIIMYMQSAQSADTEGSSLQADKVGALMYFDYGSTAYMNTVVSTVDSTGIERIFASGSDGYVYELDKGTSLDGANIQSHLMLAFNSSKSPRTRKHYRRTVLQATCKNTAQVNIGYELNYGSTESDSGYRNFQTLLGNGGFWDIFTFDLFNWDAAAVAEYTIDTPGNGRNIGMLIYGDTNIDEPYTVHSSITHYTLGRLER